MPICAHCSKTFPNRVIIDGKERVLNHRRYCLECSPFGLHNTCPPGYIRTGKKRKQDHDKIYAYRKNLKLRAIAYKGGKCQICGYDKCVRALSFHHIDPATKIKGLGSVSWGWGKIKAEADKCVLLCANCHMEVEAGVTNLPS